LMAIPFTGMPKESVAFLHIRSDWMKATDSPEPATWYEFVELLQKFKDSGYNGGAYSLSTDNELSMLYSLFQSFHSYPKMWVDDGAGNLVYGAIMPETRTALLAMQELNSKGILDPEFGSKDMEKVNEDIISGKLGVLSMPFYVPVHPFQVAKNNEENLEHKFEIIHSHPLLLTKQTQCRYEFLKSYYNTSHRNVIKYKRKYNTG